MSTSDLGNLATELDEHFGARSPRRRLFAVLAWSGTGFAVMAALTLAFADKALGVSLLGGAVSAGLGTVGFIAISAIASRLAGRAAAHVLLWATSVFYAAIICVFAASFGIDPVLAAGAVVGTGVAVLTVLAFAVATGFGGLAMGMRWIAFIALATGTLYVIEPGLWWVGLAGGFLLSVTVEMTLGAAFDRPYVPEPALAACLVAGVTAIVILVLFALIRFGIRLAAGAAIVGADAARH